MGTGDVHNNPRGGGGTPINGLYKCVLLNRVWFLVSDSEKAIKITLYIWKRGICCFSLTLEKGDFFLIVPNFSQLSTLGANPGGGGTPM